MAEEKMPIELQQERPATEAKRPYVKPAIAEEESYETCATLSCSLHQGETSCQGRGRHANKTA
jgi:hypothetical protein